MSFFSEFKEFAVKGNVVDLAVGVIIGAAFGKIVDSLVKDVLMPLLSLVTGGIDLKGLFINLGKGDYATLELAEKAGAATLRYGNFLQAIIDFALIAFAIFVFISQVNRMRKQDAPPEVSAVPAPPAEDIVLLREIRDALARR